MVLGPHYIRGGGGSLQCRWSPTPSFWFTRSGAGPENLHFYQFPRGYWSPYRTLRPREERGRGKRRGRGQVTGP